MKYSIYIMGAAALFVFSSVAAAQDSGKLLRAVSGADGLFETVQVNNQTVHRSTPAGGGRYQYYMYFQCDDQVRDRTIYIEVHYLDYGFGYLRMEYNSIHNHYDNGFEAFQNYLQDSRQLRTAVFRLPRADFKNAQNMAADLRLSTDGTLQMHIVSMRWFAEPTPLYQKYAEDWMSPYNGPVIPASERVDATSLLGKVIAGYQGWFRTAGDPSGSGWVHYHRGSFNDPTVEMWPDMLEYSAEERYPVPGWTHPDGRPAWLFSSANKKTVLRHFQWMQAYGIDGVAVQRFGVYVSKQHVKETFRIPGYVREAANRTGRTYYIMYDLSGMNTATLVDLIRDDWQFLVDSLKITADERYLHHNGKPVVGIFGFFSDRFSAAKAHEILDIFKLPGRYNAFTVNSGQWWWRTDTAPGWADVFKRMDSYFAWNVGHYSGEYAYTGY